MIRMLSVAVVLIASISTARAQNAPAVCPADECFAMKAYSEGMSEVVKSKLASERATEAAVKAFAAQMVKDHTACNEKIAKLAASKGIALPTTLDPVNAATTARLATLTGSDFDKTYMTAQIGAHEDALHLFGREAYKGEDAELKALAHDTLPTLMEHTKMSFELAGKEKELAKFMKIHDYAKQVWTEK